MISLSKYSHVHFKLYLIDILNLEFWRYVIRKMRIHDVIVNKILNGDQKKG